MVEAGGDESDAPDDAPNPDDDGDSPASKIKLELNCATDEQRLAQDFFNTCIPNHSFVTITLKDPTDDVPFLPFQLLTKRQTIISVSTYALAEQAAKLKLWGVQPYDISKGSELSADAKKIDAFQSADTWDLDILSYIGDPIDGRAAVHTWEVRISDVYGCEEFHTPTLVEYSGSLMSSNAPVLALIDALRGDHFIAMYASFKHHRRGGKYYDARALPSKRAYLQCCLTQASLYSKGVSDFVSGKSESFYRLLLRDPKKALACKTSRDCRLALKDVDASLVPLYVPTSVLLPRGVDVDSGEEGPSVGAIVSSKPKRAARKSAIPLEDEAKVGSGTGDSSSSSSSSSSSTSIAASCDTDAQKKCSVDGDSRSRSSSDCVSVPKFIGGMRVKREQHKTKNLMDSELTATNMATHADVSAVST